MHINWIIALAWIGLVSIVIVAGGLIGAAVWLGLRAFMGG